MEEITQAFYQDLEKLKQAGASHEQATFEVYCNARKRARGAK